MGATSWWDTSLEPRGEVNPNWKCCLAVLVLLSRCPSFSALCPGSLALEDRPFWASLHSVFCLGLANRRYQQEGGWQEEREAGVVFILSLL